MAETRRYFAVRESYPHVFGEALQAVLGLPVEVLTVLGLPSGALSLELALQAGSIETQGSHVVDRPNPVCSPATLPRTRKGEGLEDPKDGREASGHLLETPKRKTLS